MKLQTVSKRLATRKNYDVQISGSLEIGYNKDTPLTDAFLKLPQLTTAQRNALTGEEGMVVYDTTLGKEMHYRAGGWGASDGLAAGSLDAAYNGGSSVTVDSAAVLLTSSLSTYGFGVTGNSVTANQVAKIIGTGVTSGTVLHLEAVEATLTSGFYIAAYDGAANDFTVGKYGAVVIAGNASTSVLTVTAGNVVLTAGNLTLSNGNVDVTGTLAVSSTSTFSGAVTMDSTAVVDVTNAAAFRVRKNSTGTTIFNIDTTGDAADTEFTLVSETTTGVGMLLTVANTTGIGLHVDGTTVTTGAVIQATAVAATMTSAGALFRGVVGGVEVFAVRDDGSIYSKATAEGTAALTIATGDITVSDGDLTLSGGEVSITDGVTTSGAGILLTSNVTTAIGQSIVANSLTSGTGLSVTSTGTITTNGELILATGNSATTSTGLVRISGTGLTSGVALSVTGGGANMTSAGIVTSLIGGAVTDGSVLKVATTGAYTGTVGVVAIAAEAATTGYIVDFGATAALTTGVALRIAHTTSVIADGGSLLRLSSTSIDTGGATNGTLIDLSSTSQVAGSFVKFVGGAVTTGVVFDISTTTGMTSGSLFRATTSTAGAVATNGIISLRATGAYTSTSNVGLLDVAATATTAGTVVHITSTSAGQTATQLLNVTASGYTTGYTGNVVQITGASTTGASNTLALIGVNTTAGNVLSVVDNALTLGSGTLVNLSHTTSVIGAGSSMLRITSTGIDTGSTTGTMLDIAATAATTATLMMVTSASLTSGIGLKFVLAGLTTGAAIDTTGIAATKQNFNMNSSTGSTAAPQTNAPTGFFKIGIGGTDQWVPYYSAT
jgi:hypothetical protein